MRNPNIFETEEEAFAHQTKVEELEQLLLTTSPEVRRIFFENNEGTLPEQINKSIRRLRQLRAAHK
ncbi:hypothetical protein [Bradyrhizobium sp. USDA 4469]